MKKQKNDRQFYTGENNTGHYNFFIIDREMIFSTDSRKKNVRSALNLSLPAIGLYAVLKAHAIDKNFCYPSLLTLAELTGTTKETMIKYIRELEDAKVLVVEKMPGQNGGRERNVYVIPAIEKERLKTESIIGSQEIITEISEAEQGRISRPSDENEQSRSENSPVKVGKADLARSGNPTVIILSKYTKQLKLTDPQEEIFNCIVDKSKTENENLINKAAKYYIESLKTIIEDGGVIIMKADTIYIKCRMSAVAIRPMFQCLDALGLYESINIEAM